MSRWNGLTAAWANKIIGAGTAGTTETTLALNSAYTYASSGVAVFFMIIPQESANITDFWIKVSSYSGTWASTDGVINVQVREGTNGSNIPGTTLIGSFTITLDGSTTGWIKKTGLAIALESGKKYCIVIGDADGGATNFVTIVSRLSTTNPGFGSISNILNASVSTSNGFSTAGTNSASFPQNIIKIGSQVYGSGGYSSIATVTNGTYERGVRFRLDEDCTLIGAAQQTDSFIYGSTIRLYADTTSPGETPLMSYTVPTDIGTGTVPTVNIMPFPESYWKKLSRNVWYRFVIQPPTNATTPRRVTIGGSPDADVLAAILPFTSSHWTDASSGSWDDSQTTATCQFGPMLVPHGGGPVPGIMRIGNSVQPIY